MVYSKWNYGILTPGPSDLYISVDYFFLNVNKLNWNKLYTNKICLYFGKQCSQNIFQLDWFRTFIPIFFWRRQYPWHILNKRFNMEIKKTKFVFECFRHFYMLALQKVICYKLREVRLQITASFSITLSGVSFEALRMNNKCVKTQSALKFNFYLFEIYEW